MAGLGSIGISNALDRGSLFIHNPLSLSQRFIWGLTPRIVFFTQGILRHDERFGYLTFEQQEGGRKLADFHQYLCHICL